MSIGYFQGPRHKLSGVLWGQKPTEIQEGGLSDALEFEEVDTGRVYRPSKGSGSSIYHLLRESKKTSRGYHGRPDSSFVQLFGDEIAKTTPFRIFLFQQEYIARAEEDEISNDITKENIDNAEEHRDPLRGYPVAQFNGVNSRAYELADNYFGDDSFLAGGWYRPAGLHSNETIWIWQTSNKEVSLKFNTNNEVVMHINDGTTTRTMTVPGLHVRDLQYHYFGIMLDRTQNKMYLFVTNQHDELAIVEEMDVPDSLGSLDEAGGRFIIGARHNGIGFLDYFAGSFSNFQIYKWSSTVDYNVLPLIFAGIREGCAKDVTVTLNGGSNRRLNNSIDIDGSIGSYVYALINLDEGLYDITMSRHFGPGNGRYTIFIDGINRGFVNTYSSAVYNDIEVFIDDIVLTKGTHFLKLQIRDNPAASDSLRNQHSLIQFNKKDGPNEGGTGHFLLLGDSFRDRSTDLVIGPADNKPYASQLSHVPSDIVPDGTRAISPLYAKEGLYDYGFYLSRRPDGGIVELLLDGKLLRSIDTYHATDTDVISTYFSTRMQQGDNKITLKVNGKNAASSGYKMTFHAIEGNIQSGSCFSDSKIFPYEQAELVQGTTHHIFNPAARFGGLLHVDSAIVGGQHVSGKDIIKRWFTGGLYKANVIYATHLAGSTFSVTVDDITVFSNISNTTPGIQFNKKLERLVTIPRGYHDVSIENHSVNNQEDQSDTSLLTFTPIGRIPIAGDAPLNIIESSPLLAEYKARRHENTAVLDMADVTADNYEELVFDISGRSDEDSANVLEIAIEVNDINLANRYRKTGIIKVNGESQEEVGQLATELVILDNNLFRLTANYIFSNKTHLVFTEHDIDTHTTIVGRGESGSHRQAYEAFSFSIIGEEISKVDKILVTGNSSLWQKGTAIALHGVKRTGAN